MLPVLFQFQSGAVKRRSGFSSQKPQRIFQFQSGAVKRQLPHSYRCQIIIFQFQSGAVKRPIYRVAFILYAYFNSKVVRLKV